MESLRNPHPIAKKQNCMNLRNNLLIVFGLSLATLSSAQDRPLESKITNVTVFLAKAQVTREAKARLDAGKNTLVITGLTSQLDPQSIQVTGKGSFIILGTSHRQNFLNELNT